MTLFKGIEALFTRVEQTEVRYEKALEKKQEELIQLQGELQDKQLVLKELHKETILGTISKETYEAETEKVAVLQKQVSELQKEINLITTYEKEDVLSVIEELEAEKRKVFQKHQGELKKLQMELLEAKLNYLKKQVEVRERYNQLVAPERKLDSLKIKMGIKKNSYVSDSFEALSMVSVANGGYENLVIQLNEVNDALRYGKTPSQLEKVVSEAKEKGIIE